MMYHYYPQKVATRDVAYDPKYHLFLDCNAIIRSWRCDLLTVVEKPIGYSLCYFCSHRYEKSNATLSQESSVR